MDCTSCHKSTLYSAGSQDQTQVPEDSEKVILLHGITPEASDRKSVAFLLVVKMNIWVS